MVRLFLRRGPACAESLPLTCFSLAELCHLATEVGEKIPTSRPKISSFSHQSPRFKPWESGS